MIAPSVLCRFVLACLVFTSCAWANEPAYTSLESAVAEIGWGSLSLGKTRDGCPSLDGTYNEAGQERIEIVESSRQPKIIQRETKPYFLLFHPRTAQGGASQIVERPITDPTSFKHEISIRQSSQSLEITIPHSKDPRLTRSILLDREKGDFKCENGFLLIGPIESSGYSDGASHQYSATIALSKLQDGALFYFKGTLSSSRSFLVFSATRNTTTYARFNSRQGSE